MPDPPASETDLPRPGRVRTRQDFARELTLLRERAGLTVRQVAGRVGVLGAHSTIGDWFAGRGLPSTSSVDLLVRVLEVCGVSESLLVEQWLQAWRRVRRAPGRRAGAPEPYRGLASFQLDDAEWFFGRQALTARLLARLGGLRAAGGGIQVVVGASGSGKSSLLRAGMIAALQRGGIPGSAAWPVVLLTPGSRPVEELAARLAPFTATPVDEMAAAMRADPERYAVHAGSDDHQLVLVVDQFEEAFTVCADSEERRLFIAALCSAASSPAGALIVLGLRADFYAQALRYPQLVAAVQAGQLAVGPMSEAELREAIVEPARKANVDIEEGLVELLLQEVAPRGGSHGGDGAHESGVLPLLSHALYVTWFQGQGKRLTIAGYREVGGIEGAVAASASTVYDELTGPQRELARRLFLDLVHIAADTADTRRRASTAELLAGHGEARAAELENVLDRFVTQRLITADANTVEISHEALLTAWPQLRAWLDTDRAGLIIGRRLTEAAAAWHREHRDPAALYRGTRLAAALEWADTTGSRSDLTLLAHEFLGASIERERDEERVARRRTRRLYQLVAGLVVLFLLAATAAVIAVQTQRATREQRNIALSEKVANEATALRATNPSLAAQLSLAAYRLAHTPDARGSLLSTFASPYATQLTSHTSAVYASEFSPDGHTLATGSADRTVRLWDVTDPHHPGQLAILTGHTGDVGSVVFSPDGHTLATGSADRTARLWDVTNPHHPTPLATLVGHTDIVRSVAMSPDGRTLATASYDQTARLWDISDPHHPSPLATLVGHREGLAAAVFSPDGHTLATAGADNPVRLWDITDPHHPAPLPSLTGHTDRVLSAAFSPDGHTLATGSFDNTIRLWDVTNPRNPGQLATLTGHNNGVVAIAFSRDGRSMVTGSYDLTVRLWDVTDPRNASTQITLRGHAGVVYTVAFSPDGNTLASGSGDNSVRLWDVHGPVVNDPSGGVDSVKLSPDGHTLATGSYRRARLWNIADVRHPDLLAVLTGHTDHIVALAFSPDGHTLATGSLDATVRLWNIADVRHPDPLAILTGHTNNVFDVAFSPEGHTLATAGADFAARLWDVTDPRHPQMLGVLTATSEVNSVAFSPDGHTIATAGGDQLVQLWDVTDFRHPRPEHFLAGHSNTVNSVAFSPDGHTLASASTDHTVRLWSVTDLQHPHALATLTGHTDGVNSVAFSPDGHTLASASTDHTVRLWDVIGRPPGPLATLTGHTDGVNRVTFSPDGHILASASGDARTQLWDLDIDRVAGQICAIAYPAITRSEWGQYFPNLAYGAPCR